MATSKIIPNADFVVETGTSGIWTYRKWNSGKIEAFASNSWGGVSGSVWNSPLYYKDITLSLPSGLFPNAPTKVFATGNEQWTMWGIRSVTSTQINIRAVTPATGGQILSGSFHVIYEP